MGNVIQDLRYAFRMLLKQPGFAAVAIITLALGIGANSAIFSVINSVLLRPLPYDEPERLVLLRNAPAFLENVPTASNLISWKDEVHSFDHLAAYGSLGGGVNLGGDPEPLRVEATEVSADFFSTIGVETIAGRQFLPEDLKEGNEEVAVISYALWQRRFGTDPEIVGQSLSLNGRKFTVVGIAAPEFSYPDKTEIWIPISFGLNRILTASVISFDIIGRIRPGLSLEQVRSEMQGFYQALKEKEEPGGFPSRPIEVFQVQSEVVKSVKPTLWILFGAVGFVLLIACANVTNLLLARAAARQKEVAIRAALGAKRSRLIWQLLVESLLLALIGGALGLLVAMWGVDLLVALTPPGLPRVSEIRLDHRVFVFTLMVSLATGILFGLAPAIQASKVDLNEALKEGALKAKAGLRHRSIRSLLVVSEVALALVLLIGAGLLIKSFAKVLALDPGFNPQNVLTVSLDLPSAKYKPDEKKAFYRDMVERLAARPAVESVAAVDNLPFGTKAISVLPFWLEGEERAVSSREDRRATRVVVTPDYFRAIGIPLASGRYFNEHDIKTSTPVIIIDQAMAQAVWPDQNPLGRHLTLAAEKNPREVIGVVGKVKHWRLEADPILTSYIPYLQAYSTPTTLVLRTTTDPMAMIAAVRDEVHTMDKDLPLFGVRTMGQRLEESLAERRFTWFLLGAFAALALMLAAIGVYGVMSYSVAQRTHEIGIRLALGAQQKDVLRLVIGQGMLLALGGVISGLCGAFALTRLMTSLLYGVSPTDAGTFAVLSVVLTGVALGACYVPARRATRVDPCVALRYE
jgi:putative ABC transport system permease protein